MISRKNCASRPELSDPACNQIKDSGGIYFSEDSSHQPGKPAMLFPLEARNI